MSGLGGGKNVIQEYNYKKYGNEVCTYAKFLSSLCIMNE